MDKKKETKEAPFFITKLDETEGIVEAIVSVFGVVDYTHDIIHPGAFTKTITERMSKIRVVDQHKIDSIFSVIGKPLEIKEISKNELPEEIISKFPSATGGLKTTTKYLLNTPEGLGAFNRIKEGAIQEYSIGFQVFDFDFEELEINGVNKMVRNIRTIKLWEYSPVIWGANQATVTTNIKNLEDTKVGRTLSNNNAQAIIKAVETLLDVLEKAGVYDNEEEKDNTKKRPEEKVDLSGSNNQESPNKEIRKRLLENAKLIEEQLENYKAKGKINGT